MKLDRRVRESKGREQAGTKFQGAIGKNVLGDGRSDGRGEVVVVRVAIHGFHVDVAEVVIVIVVVIKV